MTMMDFDPKKWRSTRMIRGYTYSMKNNSEYTLKRLAGVRYRIVERRFFHQPSMWSDKYVWGWVKFREPLPLWDAMEAGLVPLFRQGVSK